MLGDWSQEAVAQVREWAPTVHTCGGQDALADISWGEIDLLACAWNNFVPRLLAARTHVVAFTSAVGGMAELPGPFLPNGATGSLVSVTVLSEEFTVSADLHPSLARMVFAERQGRTTFRGSSAIIYQESNRIGVARKMADRGNRAELLVDVADKAGQLVRRGSLIRSKDPDAAIGVAYIDPGTRKGFAWLPEFTAPTRWLRALSEAWSEHDSDAFPGHADWHRKTKWQTSEERTHSAALDELIEERARQIRASEIRELEIRQKLEAAQDAAASGLRRLLTTQSDELASVVAGCFEDMGFVVRNMDAEIPEGAAKREDLRLTIPGRDDWTAIVEVKGYATGGAGSRDLLKIQRFEKLFAQQTGGVFPDKVIYVCNAQYKLPPDRRERPFHSDAATANDFGGDGNLVLDTRDLFRLCCDGLGGSEARDLIVEAVGVFEYPAAE